MALTRTLSGCNLTMVGEGRSRLPFPTGKETMNESMHVTSITITRTLQPNGQLGIQFSHSPETISFVETLGMLSAAQWHLYAQMTNAYGG